MQEGLRQGRERHHRLVGVDAAGETDGDSQEQEADALRVSCARDDPLHRRRSHTLVLLPVRGRTPALSRHAGESLGGDGGQLVCQLGEDAGGPEVREEEGGDKFWAAVVQGGERTSLPAPDARRVLGLVAGATERAEACGGCAGDVVEDGAW
eukprot:168653-Hanusia_phi.AAC.1